MSGWVILTGLAAALSNASAPALAQTQAERCDALGDWSPVHLPPVGGEAAIPCSDADLAAFAAANPVPAGVAACDVKDRKFRVVYSVNQPSGFFDRFIVGEGAAVAFNVDGHRAFRRGGKSADGFYAFQIVEIDASRSIIMSVSAKAGDSAHFSAITGCFFNTFEFTKS